MTGPAPTTAATPWQEYLAAAGALQAVHRGHAEASAAATHAASVARAELARVSARLEQQRARLDGTAGPARTAGPAGTAPAPAEVASLVTGGPAAVHAALLRAHQLLADTDSALADRPGPARRRLLRLPRLRRLRRLPRLRRRGRPGRVRNR